MTSDDTQPSLAQANLVNWPLTRFCYLIVIITI
jgi:hypothetical protein